MNGVKTGVLTLAASIAAAAPALAQVDQARAKEWFQQAAALCEREAGRLWGLSLCGPMAIVDASTRTIATNQPAPDVKWPAAFGFANAAMDWGGTRWSIFVWQHMGPVTERMRGRLMMHELFHRLQPELGLLMQDGQNSHLDTPEGRYWLQLEWRALEKALSSTGPERDAAVRDALGFRMARRRHFPEAAENERPMEVNEGLAQYTGTVVAAPSGSEAAADAIGQLKEAPVINETLVRTFPYPSGAAYGILLDGWSPGWTRRIKSSDDLGELLMAASKLDPTEIAEAAALRYGGAQLKIGEAQRETERQLRVAELRRQFVDGPVLVLPNGRSNSFVTNGLTPIPEQGTVYPSFRTTGDWGSLEAAKALMSGDWKTVTVPAPTKVDGAALTGDGWTVSLSPGWAVRPGRRSGDFQVVRDSAPSGAAPAVRPPL